MPAFARSILAKFHDVDPYAGFDFRAHPQDVQGGGGLPVMREIADAVKPQLIVEVGTWKGSSAIFWANFLKERGIDGAVVCIDTWLGGLDHITQPQGHGWEIKPYRQHGYSTLYFQFLANVCYAGLQDYIVPIPATSVIGARWLAYHDLHPELIYIDASHDEDDVYHDIVEYWKMLKYGGMMCGDDWLVAWYGVICAVNRFVRERDLRLQVAPPIWLIQKSLSTESQLVLNTIEQKLKALKPEVPG